MTGVFENEKQLFAVLEEVVEALDNAADGGEGLIEHRHFLDEDPSVGSVAHADTHDAHHGVDYDDLLVGVVALLELLLLLLAGNLLDEDAAHADQCVDDADVRQQLLVIRRQPARDLDLHRQKVRYRDLVPIDEVYQLLQYFEDALAVVVANLLARHLLLDYLVSIVNKHVQAQLFNGHFHDHESVNQLQLMCHLHLGSLGVQRQVLLGSYMLYPNNRLSSQLQVAIRLDHKFSLLVGHFSEAGISNYIDAEVLILLPRMNVKDHPVLDLFFMHSDGLKFAFLQPNIEVRSKFVDYLFKSYQIFVLGHYHVQIFPGLDVEQLVNPDVG